MNEEELNDPYESELKKEKKAENERIEEAKDDLTEGKIRRQREGEGTRDFRKRIYPDYKANRRKNQQRLGDDDIQAQGDALSNPTKDQLKDKTPEEIEAAKTGLEEAKKRMRGQSVPKKDQDGFLRILGKGLTVYGQAMDRVDKEVLGRVGFGDKNLYTARRGIIDGLSQRHVALALLGEFLLPDTVDLATLGLSYIPKRFLKTPKLLKMWAKSTKAATKSEAAGDFAGAAILGGRPRLARRTQFNELGDIDELDQISKYYPQMQKASADVSKGTETFKRPLTTPEKTKQKILEGKKADVFDLEAATQGPGIEGKPGSPKYSKKVRAGVTKIDKKLVSSLQKKYGGTDEQAKQFLQLQKDNKAQIEAARVALNKEFKLRQFGFAYEDMMDALEGFDDLLRGMGPAKAMQAMKKVKPDITPNELMDFADALRVDAGSYDIGHIVAAKNQFRRGQKGAEVHLVNDWQIINYFN